MQRCWMHPCILDSVSHFSSIKNDMKVIFYILLTLSLSSSGIAQQISQSDSQQFGGRISDEIKLLGVKIDEMDKRLNNRIDEMDKRIVAQFNTHERSISTVQWTLNLLLIIIVVVLAVPYVVRSIREQEDQRKNAELRERELAALREEFWQLKQQLHELKEKVPSESGQE